ncbi:hypothetical protein EI94DRAFT_1707976 [Lactarius quietus]|nr:hypothetical protein EI94DRAFT_1707976 [Lactarius quietus]
MSSKTPLPRMSLRLRETDTQKHPGLPDMPCPRRSTQEVQAEKAEKVSLREEKGRLCSNTIRATAKLETRMEAQLKEKLATAHRPPPSSQKKVRHMPKRVPPEVRSEENQARSAEESEAESKDISKEFEPNRDEDPANKGNDSEDDKSVLDISSDEEPRKQKTKSKKSRNRQLWVDIQSTQGKNMSEDGNVKRKASELLEELTEDRRYTQKKAKKTKSGLRDNWIKRTCIESEDNDWQTQTSKGGREEQGREGGAREREARARVE